MNSWSLLHPLPPSNALKVLFFGGKKQNPRGRCSIIRQPTKTGQKNGFGECNVKVCLLNLRELSAWMVNLVEKKHPSRE